MYSNYDLRLGLAIWMVVIGIVVVVHWRKGNLGVGLVFGYLFNLWLLHWPATLLNLLPWYSYQDMGIIKAGFEQSVYGVVAFGVGTLLLAPLLRLARPRNSAVRSEQLTLSAPDPRLPKIYTMTGLVSFFLVFPFSGRIPSLTALSATAYLLLFVGLCLGCWQAWKTQDQRAFVGWLALAASWPFLMIISQGFLGYGVVGLSIVLLFVASFVRSRWKVIIAGLLIGYLGLSFYVSYMRDRTEIRAAVWGGQALSERIHRVYSTVSNLEWFDIHNQDHLWLVDARLNQNSLVGAAVYYISAGYQDYAAGETFWEAALALIPRAVWPEKPFSAGNSEMVTKYTGIMFARGTSVGPGPVMEFYINFGTLGVIVGFLILGTVVAMIDVAAARCLWQGDWQRFALWFLPGVGLLQTGGSLVEVASTTAAAVVTIFLVNRFLIPFLEVKRPGAAQRGYA